MTPDYRRAYDEVLRHPVDLIVGIDEVGAGAYAGPAYMAAVLASPYFHYPGLRDSKKLDLAWREQHYDELVRQLDPRNIRVAIRSPERIDQHGIRRALDDMLLELVEWAALEAAGRRKQAAVIVDGIVGLPGHFLGCSVHAIPKADTFAPAVMAAANIAKTLRDRHMISLDDDYPGFGFRFHKGYSGNGTHDRVMEELGLTPEHRRSFKNVAAIERRRREQGTDSERGQHIRR